MTEKNVRVAMIGLGFGAEFLPIYQDHPNAAICRRSEKELNDPHLVNEFVSALVEDRDPRPSPATSANWTCVGLCAHESAKQGAPSCDCPTSRLE